MSPLGPGGHFLCTVTACLLTCLFAAAATAGPDFEITAPGPQGPLSGTLLRADGTDPPIVLIIPGSGPVDRDGNGPNGLHTNTYRLIAEGLRGHGISSVRFDKRGLFKSRDATDEPDRVTLDAYGKDVRNWISRIRALTSAPCVWLLGHSEGGLVAINHAAASPDRICGLLLAAVPGRPLADVLQAQLSQNPANAPLLDQATLAIRELEAGRRLSLDGLHPALQVLFRNSVQDFWMDLFAFEARERLGLFGGPVLVLQGTNDVQVGVADANALSSSHGTARMLILENANHMLKAVETDGYFENLRTYADPHIPVHPGVVSGIADFIKQHGERG